MGFWTAFILGFAGSLHCAAMCGPLALALPVDRSSAFAAAVGRVVYNLGRILTYCLLGLLFGLVGKTLLMAGVQRWVSIGLGIILVTGLFASRRLALWSPVNAMIRRLKTPMGSLLRQPSFAALALLGLLNGLLPCGLVYVACAGAVATGGIARGAGFMAFFGLGTLPMLLLVSSSRNLLPLPLRLRLRAAIPVSVFLLGSLLILRGMSLGIPYLSPDLSGNSAACCLR